MAACLSSYSVVSGTDGTSYFGSAPALLLPAALLQASTSLGLPVPNESASGGQYNCFYQVSLHVDQAQLPVLGSQNFRTTHNPGFTHHGQSLKVDGCPPSSSSPPWQYRLSQVSFFLFKKLLSMPPMLFLTRSLLDHWSLPQIAQHPRTCSNVAEPQLNSSRAPVRFPHCRSRVSNQYPHSLVLVGRPSTPINSVI